MAELTRLLAEQRRTDIDFHSILFFEPDPIERMTKGTLTEKFVNTIASNPLDIKFEKILHRVYNFYNEATNSWFRKIYPADKLYSAGNLATASWTQLRQPYLKGVNIKCFTITKSNVLEPFPF